MPGLRWPKDREDRLRDLWMAGATFKEIAVTLGADSRGIQAKVYRMKLPRRYSTPQNENPVFIQLRAEKRSARYIAEKMGVGVSTVESWVRKALLAGATERFSAWTMEADAELVRLWQRGLSPATIARQMKRTAPSVAARGRRLGMKPNRTYPKARKPAPPRDYKADHLKALIRTPRPAVTSTLWNETATSRPWLDRESGECAFPLGERGAIQSCCAPVLEGDSYCEHHRLIMGGIRISNSNAWRDRQPEMRAAA